MYGLVRVGTSVTEEERRPLEVLAPLSRLECHV